MLWNTPKHHFGSNGVEWRLHNFGTPKQCIQSRNTSFESFYLSKVSEILRNTTKHHFGSNGDVSQLWYPEIVHWGSDASFASCYLSKVSEMLWNTPKHQLESNGVEWMLHNFGTPKQCQARNTSFASFYLSTVSEMLRNTPKHHFWVQRSRMDASQLRYPKTVHSVPKHKFCIFLPVEG
jgi:hypothetical protein